MAAKRAAGRDLIIPPIANVRRRRKAQRDIYYGLRTYFPNRFYFDFTADQRDMIATILNVIRNGGDQSMAAPRGDGKTSIVECVITLAICFGWVSFPLLVAATGRDADQILSNIKAEFETNDTLAEDFPEVCVPIRALEGAPQRAGGQTILPEKGERYRTRMQWSGDRVIFPTVKGSKASGAVMMTRGLDGAIRGVRHRDRRPDFVLIDDPDTEESAVSETQQEKREHTIEGTLAGVGGPGKKIGRVMLGTLLNRTCLAAKYTDAKSKPSWKGRRFRLLKAMPEREDLWARYVQLRQDGFDPNSDTAIEAAHEFYLANRAAMDAGAEVSNPNRFNPHAFPPEVSALQCCYNWIADKGLASFQTEYQNDPAEEDSAQTNGLTAGLVQKRLSGYPMNIVPRGAIAITAFLDVGQSKGCHYAVVAWFAGARGHVIDYGVQDVHNIEQLGPERAVLAALRAWREDRLANPYQSESGSPVDLDLVLVDSGDGNLESTVYQFTRESGLPFRASKGFGSKHDQSPFKAPQKRTRDLRPGEGWFESRQRLVLDGAGVPGGLWLVCMNSDHWKEWLHNRFITEHRDEKHNFRRGAMSLFGIEETRHHTIARHIVSEMMEAEMVRGKGMVRKWRVRNRNNDWLDCLAGASCAGAMCGVSLNADARPGGTLAGGRLGGAGGGDPHDWSQWGKPAGGGGDEEQPKPGRKGGAGRSGGGARKGATPWRQQSPGVEVG